jgi:hypothetical protein
VNLDDLPGAALRNDRGLPYYSQYGEDRRLIENIPLPGIGTFAEVGAADGRTFSNSLVFESLGWGGRPG